MTERNATVPPDQASGGNVAGVERKRRRFSLLTRQDKLILTVLIGLPTLVHLSLIWLPTLASVVLSFTSWNGIGGLATIEFAGLKNYQDMVSVYPPFWDALQHNLIWLTVLVTIASPFGMFLAVLLDKEIRGSRFYQTALFLPVVLSLAIIGFIWELQYRPEEGFINNVLGTTGQDNLIDWLGNRSLNLWAVLVAASWRHVGYIMIIYLAGMKSVDPQLREAAAIDGANEVQAFFRVVFPSLRSINIVVLVITVIESLRAFDLVFIINRGLNGLELLSVLVTNNIVGEASRVGFGSALAVVLLVVALGPIILFLRRAMREEPA